MTPETKEQRQLGRQITGPREIPALDEFLADDRLGPALEQVSRKALVEIVRTVFANARGDLAGSSKSPKNSVAKVTYGSLISATLKEAQIVSRKSLNRVINCTGVIAHTNLGRAPLSDKSLAQVQALVAGYQTLEFDLETGARGKRGLDVEADLCVLTGAEAALVVNNCAGALFLLLNTLSKRKETILSRGEMVQIGGGFRVPDVMRRSGAKLVEIGATNITTVADYEQAVGKKTALLLKVNRSNFSQHGFTGEASVKDLATVASESEIPLIYDLGSGLVVNPEDVNLARYPSVIGALRDGADIVCFSGDKLFGSAQAGMIVGKESIISKLRKNPLYRALRPDKTTFALLSQTLQSYLNDTWRQDIPLWKMALRSESELYQFGRDLIASIADNSNLILTASVGRYGAGSVPDAEIPSCALGLKTKRSAKVVARLFRQQNPPIIGRIENDLFMLDLLTVTPDDRESLLKALTEIIPQLR